MSCKTSSSKDNQGVPGPTPSGNPTSKDNTGLPNPSPSDTPTAGSPSGGKPIIKPEGINPESTPWFSMRNDCRDASSTQLLDLHATGSSGQLNFSYIDFTVGHDSFHTGSGTSGTPQGSIRAKECEVIQSYFTAVSDVWQGQDYFDVFSKGDSVSFSPQFDFNYRDSIKIAGFNDFSAAMASPKQFEADAVTATISYTVKRGSKGIVLVNDIPVTVQCLQKLSYQLYTYRTVFPANPTEANYCRKIAPDTDGRDADCLAVEHWLCSQSRDLRGRCPAAKAKPTLDSCTYVIPSLPLVNFSGETIGSAKVGGFLFKINDRSNPDTLGYRMTVNRIELTPAQR